MQDDYYSWSVGDTRTTLVKGNHEDFCMYQLRSGVEHRVSTCHNHVESHVAALGIHYLRCIGAFNDFKRDKLEDVLSFCRACPDDGEGEYQAPMFYLFRFPRPLQTRPGNRHIIPSQQGPPWEAYLCQERCLGVYGQTEDDPRIIWTPDDMSDLFKGLCYHVAHFGYTSPREVIDVITEGFKEQDL